MVVVCPSCGCAEDVSEEGRVFDWIRSLGGATSAGAPKRLHARDLPSTQEAIEIVTAQDDVLVLRDGDVVAAVGFASIRALWESP